MDPVELIAKQLHQYQQQNERDHEQICKKIDDIYRVVDVISSKTSSHDKRYDDIESQLKEISDTIKVMHEDNLKRDHLRNWIIKALGVAAVIAGLITTVWKLGLFN